METFWLPKASAPCVECGRAIQVVQVNLLSVWEVHKRDWKKAPRRDEDLIELKGRLELQ